jgi:hypothetical protein
MSKKAPTTIEPAVEVDSTALIITTETINKALATYNPIKEELAEIVKEYAELTIKDTKDKVGLAAVTVAYKNAREIRLKVEKIRKAINDAPLTLQRMNNAAAKELTELAQPCEEQLKAKIDAIEKAVELENRAEEARRNKMLQDAGYQMSGSFWICGPYQIAWTSIMEMSEEDLNQAVTNADAYQKEQARLLEEKRIADEAAEKERQRKAEELAQQEAKLKADREALEKEQAEFLKWKAAQAKAAKPAPAPAPAAPQCEPTHMVTVHQHESPQKIAEPVTVPAQAAPLQHTTEFKSAAVEVSPEFAFGFNTCRAIVVADLANELLKLSRQQWHDRFAAMDAPATRMFEFVEGYKKMRNLQMKYFREKTPENLTAAKNQEKFLDELARSL